MTRLSKAGRGRRSNLGAAYARFLALCACTSFLVACQSLAADRPAYGITTSAVSDGELVLTEPRIGEARGIIFVRGDVCGLNGAEASAPHALQVTGYDGSRREMFRRVIVTKPRDMRSGKLCRSYSAALAGVRAPASIEVRPAARALAPDSRRDKDVPGEAKQAVRQAQPGTA